MGAWVIGSSIISPLGFSSEDNYANVRLGKSGLERITDSSLSPNDIFAGRITAITSDSKSSRFEQMCLEATRIALKGIALDVDRTLFILSTTKGNIALLDSNDQHRVPLHAVANWLARHSGLKNSIVVSNACISGVLALIVGKRYLDGGKYDHVVVVGSDELSKFVVSGFESLQALSPVQCKPFDSTRNGINLGEAAAAMVLSSQPSSAGSPHSIKISGGGLSNDANHISGPSRTGDELADAIFQAMHEAKKTAADIDFISAHGTATLFNDEMEAKAFTIAGLSAVPLNSLKGYFGHTLGAAGIVESVISIKSLLQGEIMASLGYDTIGVSGKINVCREITAAPLKVCLKTASGFGGCNAAIILEKEVA